MTRNDSFSRLQFSRSLFSRSSFSRSSFSRQLAWNVAFPVFISPIVWNTCENLHYESVYFKELHNEQGVLMTENIQDGGSCSVNYY